MRSFTQVLIGKLFYIVSCLIIILYSFNFMAFIFLIIAIYFLKKGITNIES